MKVQVECYAGRKADERPIRFHLYQRDYLVEEIVDQWYGPAATFFKVRASDGFYILRCGEPAGEWTLESFRRAVTSPTDSSSSPVSGGSPGDA